jgi:hypothetical protein
VNSERHMSTDATGSRSESLVMLYKCCEREKKDVCVHIEINANNEIRN